LNDGEILFRNVTYKFWMCFSFSSYLTNFSVQVLKPYNILLNNAKVTCLEIGEFDFMSVNLSSIDHSKESFEGNPNFLLTFVILAMMNEIILDLKSYQPTSMIPLQTYNVTTIIIFNRKRVYKEIHRSLLQSRVVI
jgi:hypothetical protein